MGLQKKLDPVAVAVNTVSRLNQMGRAVDPHKRDCEACASAGMLAALKLYQSKEHRECEDFYYSCPMHPEYGGNEDRDYCNCDKKETDERIAELEKESA